MPSCCVIGTRNCGGIDCRSWAFAWTDFGTSAKEQQEMLGTLEMTEAAETSLKQERKRKMSLSLVLVEIQGDHVRMWLMEEKAEREKHANWAGKC